MVSVQIVSRVIVHKIKKQTFDLTLLSLKHFLKEISIFLRAAPLKRGSPLLLLPDHLCVT